MLAHPHVLAILALTLLPAAALRGQQVRIGKDAFLPENGRSEYSRYVNWRPADGETVTLNPPRISWPYWPDWPRNWNNEHHTFRLQISSNPDASQPLVDITSSVNFYNCLPELKGARQWYWRVGYDVGSDKEHWSAIRSFAIDRDAVVWDRARLANPDLAQLGHPRILFTRETLPRIRQLGHTDPASQAALDWMRAQADRTLQESWWKDFPPTDRTVQPRTPFYAIAHQLALVAFVWRMTEDERYAGVKERAVTWASYPPGGRSSPEGLGGDGSEDATQGNEFLALLFDWLYEDLTDAERQTMIDSLTWRVDHIMNRFVWRGRRQGGPMLRLTFGPARSVDREKGGDQRLPLDRTADWKRFTWEVDVPSGATEVAVEAFNYYAAGEVRWDAIRVQSDLENRDLLRNADFAAARGDQPADWRPHVFGTAATVRYDPQGGRSQSGAVVITCKDSSQRGAWGQSVALRGVKRLSLEGWYRTDLADDAPVMATSLSGMISSHQFEASMDTAVCALALYEHSPVARQWYELIVNYLIGVTSGHGFDECWNEGPGYGTSKSKWMTNASLYFDTTIPGAAFGRNPFYSRMGDFFRHVIPIGMDHNAWGNQNNASRGNHLATFRKLAHLTGDGRFLFNYQQYRGRAFSDFRPWIEYVLPAHYREPDPVAESDPVAVFPIDGWAMAATGPPSDPDTYRNGAGVIFQCRPRGGYGHSFYSDGSFQLHAYGQMLNHGGGSSANLDAFAYHSMSHNTVLIDGLGQAQPSRGQLYPTYGRLVGFSRGQLGGGNRKEDGSSQAGSFVYFAGDATRCYPREPGDYTRWGLPLGKVYQERAVDHLQRFVRHIIFVRGEYFVIYDDLACSRPATFTWLYHIRPQRPFAFDAQGFAFDYSVGDVRVRLQHFAKPDELVLDDRQGLDGLVNPLTQEDYRQWRKGDILCGHHLWVSNRQPAAQWRFLAVVYPTRPGQAAPPIQRVDDNTVRVGNDVLCFDPASPAASRATLLVDVEAFRQR